MPHPLRQPSATLPARPRVEPIDLPADAPAPRSAVRAKLRRLAADTRVVPHSHPSDQVAMSGTGVIRMTVAHSTCIVPPSHALWIAPGAEHVVTVLEGAEIRTLYGHPSARFPPATRRAP